MFYWINATFYRGKKRHDKGLILNNFGSRSARISSESDWESCRFHITDCTSSTLIKSPIFSRYVETMAHLLIDSS